MLSPYFVTFNSHLFSQLLKYNTALHVNTLMGKNEFDWSIISDWFNGKLAAFKVSKVRL